MKGREPGCLSRPSAKGNINSLPTKVANELKDVVTKTKDNKRLTLTLALSYGSREELIKTVKEISLKVKNNLISPENIDKSVINNHLYNQNFALFLLYVHLNLEHL